MAARGAAVARAARAAARAADAAARAAVVEVAMVGAHKEEGAARVWLVVLRDAIDRLPLPRLV